MVKKLCIVFIASCCLTASAQERPLRDRLNDLATYAGVDVTPDTIARWTGWVETGESADASMPERNDAWQRFLLSFYRNLGTVPTPLINEQTLASWSQYLTMPFFKGRILDFKQIGRDGIPAEEIVSTTGAGKEHLLLIPPLGFGPELFEVLEERYGAEYTFHKVAFPHGTNSWKFPGQARLAEAEWLSKTEHAIISYLYKRGIDRVKIVAQGTGAYMAFSVASKLKQVDAIVCINGLYKTSLRNPETQSESDITYRHHVAEHAFPSALIVQFAPSILTRNFAFSSDPDINAKYLAEVTPDVVNSLFRYNAEFAAQDITPTIAGLNIPILSLVSVHNDQSPQMSNRSVIQGWQELKANAPEMPLSIVEMYDAQNLLHIEKPDLFDFYFSSFLKNPTKGVEQITNQSQITVDLTSTKASEMLVLGTTQIAVHYSQPRVDQREIFGQLVPFDNIWRGGANDATTLEVSGDVLVNGTHLLKKGRYSLFLIPNQQKWEVVINAIPNQWGAFNYKKNYDALRFSVIPESTDHTEYLSYNLEKLQPDKARLSLSWETSTIAFELSEHFELPVPPAALESLSWKEILTDTQGDGVQPDLPDGKALSYTQHQDTIWFRFDLYKYDNPRAFALNVLFDTDNDQETGRVWFGQNTTYTFDKGITLWMRKSGSGFQGINGIMLPNDFTTGNQNLAYMNNIAFYLDIERNRFYAGVKISDLELIGKRVGVIGAVGEFQTWNDDIGDDRSATIRLK